MWGITQGVLLFRFRFIENFWNHIKKIFKNCLNKKGESQLKKETKEDQLALKKGIHHK